MNIGSPWNILKNNKCRFLNNNIAFIRKLWKSINIGLCLFQTFEQKVIEGFWNYIMPIWNIKLSFLKPEPKTQIKQTMNSLKSLGYTMKLQNYKLDSNLTTKSAILTCKTTKVTKPQIKQTNKQSVAWNSKIVKLLHG